MCVDVDVVREESKELEEMEEYVDAIPANLIDDGNENED